MNQLLTREKYADVPAVRMPAITRPLADRDDYATIPADTLGPDDETERRPVVARDGLLSMIQAFAREDGISPRALIWRLVRVEYHRRMISREVAAMEAAQ